MKTLNEKLNACGKDYKKNDTALIIFVEQKLPPSFDMFIQTRNRAIEMSKWTITNTFEEFCQGLINEQDRLISTGQLSFNQALMTHNKGNYNKNSKNNHKPPTQRSMV